MTAISDTVAALRERLREDQVVTEHHRLRSFETDALAHLRAIPAVVVFPESTEDVRAVVRICRDRGVAYVARGSGTGLSAGALPIVDGVLIVMTRLNRLIEIDLDNERVRLEPGVVNAKISQAIAPQGYYYAPDPSSQPVCTIGGNVAENSGGAHCLKYGFTTNHVTGIEMVTPEGDLVSLGGDKTLDAPGYDLLGAFVGSEGTLGIVTSVTARILRSPEAVRTVLIGFAHTDDAGEAVSAIIAAGLLPAAIEMMDELAIEAAEAAVHCNYPPEAKAVLLVEFDGPEEEVAHLSRVVEEICLSHQANHVRVASSDHERAQLWKGRKSAFAAVGRISRSFLVQDGVVPRTALSEVLRAIGRLARARGLRVANVFHAGDGNLHPLVLYDAQVEGQAEDAHALSGEIIDLCIENGGSITGEHGVGLDKVAYMPKMFAEADLETMIRLRMSFDPSGLCNPGKAIPTPNLCGEATWRERRAQGTTAAAGG
jgi:glycolate oxidase